MRELTDHIVDGDSTNHQLTLSVLDEPGNGGACHYYRIEGFDTRSNISDQDQAFQGVDILFQHGPIKEFGVNGITQEALLAIIADRLRGFQAGPFACDANEQALMAVQSALWHLQTRTRERILRGVEGTTNK